MAAAGLVDWSVMMADFFERSPSTTTSRYDTISDQVLRTLITFECIIERTDVLMEYPSEERGNTEAQREGR
jgi:hypothetical protein